MNILVYDNSPAVRTMIQRNILDLQHSINIVLAPNMFLVNKALCNSNFNVAIIDMDNLEGMFSSFIERAKLHNPDITIILLTSFPTQKLFEKFKIKGVDYCLDKVHEFERFIKTIYSILSRYPQLSSAAS